MNKAELIAAVVEKSGMSKADSEKAVNAAFEAITEALSKGDKVKLIGFGSCEVRERAPRTGRTPQTGETVEIPALKAVAFKPGNALTGAVR